MALKDVLLTAPNATLLTVPVETALIRGDLSGEVGGGSPTSTTSRPVISDRANVPLHDHSRVLRMLPHIQHTSGMGGSYNLPLADSVIILNDSTTTLNLPIPVISDTGDRRASYGTSASTSGALIGTRDGSRSRAPLFSDMPLGGVVDQPTGGAVENGVWSPANVFLAQAGHQITVTVIQDENGTRSVAAWKQYQEVGLTATGSVLTVPAAATGAHKATTYLFQWLGIHVGWVLLSTTSSYDPVMRPLKSASTKYVRGFVLRNGVDETLMDAASADIMAWPEGVRKWLYDMGAWLHPSTRGGSGVGGGTMSGFIYSASGGTIGVNASAVGGLTSGSYPFRESWMNVATTNTVSNARHEFVHIIDANIYKTGVWKTGRQFTVPAGTAYLNSINGVKATLGSNTNIVAPTLLGDPNLQAFFFTSRSTYLSSPWAGAQAYNLSDLSYRTERDIMFEWLPAIVAGYLTYQTDTTKGTAELTCGAPPSIHASIRTYLDTVFRSSGLNLF